MDGQHFIGRDTANKSAQTPCYIQMSINQSASSRQLVSAFISSWPGVVRGVVCLYYAVTSGVSILDLYPGLSFCWCFDGVLVYLVCLCWFFWKFMGVLMRDWLSVKWKLCFWVGYLMLGSWIFVGNSDVFFW